MFTSVFMAGAALAAAQEPEAVSWIRDRAIPLETVEAGHGFSDMQRPRPVRARRGTTARDGIADIVGDARIVSLGEATHGTREFFQLKHRMLEYLATEMGFDIFAIEANMPEAYRLNDYVLHGVGDPKALLKGMYFWTWNTEEVLDMILWMREFNASGKGRLQFTGFDMQYPAVAAQIARDFVVSAEPAYLSNLDRIYNDALKPLPGFGVATASFAAAAVAGKRIRFTGYIRTDEIVRGYAGLWWRVDGNSGLLKIDNMSGRGAKGTTDWKQYEIVMDVPLEATSISFGAIHPGDGGACFDSLAVEVNGVPYPGGTQADLDFEASLPRGFFTGGEGYSLAVDSAVSHSGSRSLCSRYLGLSVAELTGRSEEIVRHMEAQRAAWLRQGMTAWNVDWAIQNARVVAQSEALMLDSGVRDPAMAANVKWILDQNPGSKIVLWAHNGHVETSPYWDNMGHVLRQMYGAAMVVFGFAFNRGGFQAVDTGGSGLREFIVDAAPADSLDGALAATGIPIFALDLRGATGAAGAWLAVPRKTRSIGAVFGPGYPYEYSEIASPQHYDALLFVENTTRARPVAGQ
jgi:erythromycin esterase-like protein